MFALVTPDLDLLAAHISGYPPRVGEVVELDGAELRVREVRHHVGAQVLGDRMRVITVVVEPAA